MRTFTGIIKGITGSGGILTITMEGTDKYKTKNIVLADNGPFVRACADAFGREVIAPGHRFDVSKVIGQYIEYKVDDFGLMVGFEPL